jgi:hypothetical protein
MHLYNWKWWKLKWKDSSTSNDETQAYANAKKLFFEKVKRLQNITIKDMKNHKNKG